MPINRRTYAVLALAAAAFLAYGSLVPFSFVWVPFDQALASFVQSLTSPMTVQARTDFVTNILLTVPLCFFVMAALRTDRIGRTGDTGAAAATLLASITLTFGVEFAQNFFPGRTDALSDIVAQSIGAIGGVVLWLGFGRVTTIWLRETLQERDQGAFAHRVLFAYLLLYAVSQLIPLDLTINLGELARKYRGGGIVLVPFTWQYASIADLLWDVGGDTLLAVPVGSAAVTLWAPRGNRRRSMGAWLLGTALIAGIEFGQVFVHSRIADATDIITGSIGVLLGVVATNALSTAQSADATRPSSNRGVWLARGGVVIMTLLLASYHWKPYNFTTSHARVVEGLHQLLSIPFSWYYIGTEFNAFTEMWRKLLLALPLGFLLDRSWPRARAFPSSLRRLALLTSGGAIMLLIETGQVFLPTRVPDLTDVLIGEVGVALGVWLAGRVGGEPVAHGNERSESMIDSRPTSLSG